MKFSAIFSMVVGALMIIQWTFFLASGQVPQLESAPLEIAFHLVAEFLTAAGLLAGGLAVLKSRAWGAALLLAALGMMIYSVINSPGYFAQRGDWALVAMFMLLLVLGLRAVVLLIRNQK